MTKHETKQLIIRNENDEEVIVDVDTKIYDLVSLLNVIGLKTKFCCENQGNKGDARIIFHEDVTDDDMAKLVRLWDGEEIYRPQIKFLKWMRIATDKGLLSNWTIVFSTLLCDMVTKRMEKLFKTEVEILFPLPITMMGRAVFGINNSKVEHIMQYLGKKTMICTLDTHDNFHKNILDDTISDIDMNNGRYLIMKINDDYFVYDKNADYASLDMPYKKYSTYDELIIAFKNDGIKFKAII